MSCTTWLRVAPQFLTPVSTGLPHDAVGNAIRAKGGLVYLAFWEYTEARKALG